MSKVLVTGGAGFIGSHFVERLLRRADVEQVTVLDALTYAGNLANLKAAQASGRFKFVHGNILDTRLVGKLVESHDAVVHFAAESHVDRSLFDAGRFIATNVHGTQILLEAARRSGVSRFVNVSTDEVYGSLASGTATEQWPLAPSIPYAASKAAGDLIARSYFETYGVPVCITRSSNNYGPRQYPEKVIPYFVSRLLQGRALRVHGDGRHLRNWLHVEDNCAGIELVLNQGVPGEVYNIGGGHDLTTNELADLLLRMLGADSSMVEHVPDRIANDRRYAMDWSKIAHLGYRPTHDLEYSLASTIAWYRSNPAFWQHTPVSGDVAALGC
ncbi:dTDP-glucose 4,6-dehydratase [Kitasatospora sp. NPDC101801]|uniref:dTDP-glucose 4,6-dehydratase n=1 Tax=Kitasatospora sp. NPDC101801 TaxID=3364103 RepID=UPI0037FC9784